MVEMELLGVRVELPTNTPIMMLREREGAGRVLPIFIGGSEATAIAMALEGMTTPRPMTHDLLAGVLDELGATLERIVVTELREGTFYAELLLRQGQDTHQVSCRPSDAIALAVRTGAAIFAAEEVLADAASSSADEAPPDEVVKQFREFIDNVNPEDFAS